ncbi:Insecticidal toxin complex protein tccz [Enterobacteriaceae bacterium]
MHIKSWTLLLTLLMPLSSVAEKRDFHFSAADVDASFEPGCIKSIKYAVDEYNEGHVDFILTDECGKRFSVFTRQNLGKKMTMAYKGHQLISAMITSRLGSNFRIPAQDIPKVVLMQILTDYDTAQDE